jgi:hypothetical protein
MKAFMVWQGQTLMALNQMAMKLSLVVVAPNGGSTKVIKARLFDSFTRKETKAKRVCQWLLQAKV